MMVTTVLFNPLFAQSQCSPPVYQRGCPGVPAGLEAGAVPRRDTGLFGRIAGGRAVSVAPESHGGTRSARPLAQRVSC